MRKGSGRQNKVPELQKPLQVEAYSQQIMAEENNSTVLREERNRNWDNGIRRRPNICTTNTRVIAKTKSSTRKQYIRWNFKRS